MSTDFIRETANKTLTSQSWLNQRMIKSLNYQPTEHIMEIARSWYEGDDTELANDFDVATLTVDGDGDGAEVIKVTTTPGKLTLTTNDKASDACGIQTNRASFYRARNPRLEAAVTLGRVDAGEFHFGLYKDADEYAMVYFDKSASANWYLRVADTTAEETSDLGVAATTDQIQITLEISDGTNSNWAGAAGTVHVWLNGTKIDVSGDIANLLTADGHYMRMYAITEDSATYTATCESLTCICNIAG